MFVKSDNGIFLRCDIPVVYQLQCRNKCEQVINTVVFMTVVHTYFYIVAMLCGVKEKGISIRSFIVNITGYRPFQVGVAGHIPFARVTHREGW